MTKPSYPSSPLLMTPGLLLRRRKRFSQASDSCFGLRMIKHHTGSLVSLPHLSVWQAFPKGAYIKSSMNQHRREGCLSDSKLNRKRFDGTAFLRLRAVTFTRRRPRLRPVLSAERNHQQFPSPPYVAHSFSERSPAGFLRRTPISCFALFI